MLPLTVVSDGLGCFEVAASLGACHDRTVTGGGKASVALEQFRFNRRCDLHAILGSFVRDGGFAAVARARDSGC